jgi:hypothetical protein
LPVEEKARRKRERTSSPRSPEAQTVSELRAEQAAADEEYLELQAENRFLRRRLEGLTVALRRRPPDDDDDDNKSDDYDDDNESDDS